MDYTFNGKFIRNKTKVEDITLVLQGNHISLNNPGFVTSVNLGEFEVSLEDGKLVYEIERFNEEVSSALRSILLTYLLKQSDKEKKE